MEIVKFKKGKSNIYELELDNMSAINSGMVVRASVYKKIRYNEDLFLDCIDHEFMRMVRKYKFSLYIDFTINFIILNFYGNFSL